MTYTKNISKYVQYLYKIHKINTEYQAAAGPAEAPGRAQAGPGPARPWAAWGWLSLFILYVLDISQMSLDICLYILSICLVYLGYVLYIFEICLDYVTSKIHYSAFRGNARRLPVIDCRTNVAMLL